MKFELNDAICTPEINIDGNAYPIVTRIYGVPVLQVELFKFNLYEKLHIYDNTIIPFVIAQYVETSKLGTIPVIFTTDCPALRSYKNHTALAIHTDAIFVYALFFLGAWQRQGVALKSCGLEFTRIWGSAFNWFFPHWNPKEDHYLSDRIRAANEAINQLYYWGWLKPFYDAYRIVKSQYLDTILKQDKARLDAESLNPDDPEEEEFPEILKQNNKWLDDLDHYLFRLGTYDTYYTPMTMGHGTRREFLVRKNRPDVNFFNSVWLKEGVEYTPECKAFTYDSLREYADPEHVREAWLYR